MKSFVAAAAHQADDLHQAKDDCSKRYLWPSGKAAKRHASAISTPVPKQNVVGVGIGEKTVNGLPTGILCVKIYVDVKYPESQLLAKERLPKTISGLPVDIEEIGTIYSLSRVRRGAKRRPLRAFAAAAAVAAAAVAMPNPRIKIRPAQPGCSVSFQDPSFQRVTAGTFGALVRDANGLYILSNNHVLADENRMPNAIILQPGMADNGIPNTDAIATVARFEPLVGGATRNKVDCAIAKVSNSNLVSNEILHIGPPRSKGNASIDMTVHKFGRQPPNYTVGQVKDINADITINFGSEVFNFENQIMIAGLNGNPFSGRGDSGALVLERDTQKAVGILFSAAITNQGKTVAFANHINNVLVALGVTLVL